LKNLTSRENNRANALEVVPSADVT